MCEICKLREKVENNHRELEFRFVQFQVELKAGREDETARCEDRINELTAEILSDLRRRASWETQIDDGQNLEDILKKVLN